MPLLSLAIFLMDLSLQVLDGSKQPATGHLRCDRICCDPRKIDKNGAPLPRNESTAATDNALNTPMKPAPCAPRLPREALGSLHPGHAPYMWGTHGHAWEAIHSLWGSPQCTRCRQAAAQRLHRGHRQRPEHPPEASSVRPPPTQRGSGVPYHAPYAWGTHGLP